MTIAAHIESSPGTTSLLAEQIMRLAVIHPNHHFVIFSSKQTSHGFKFSSNCKLLLIKPVIRNSLLVHYWYNYKLPKLLEKCNASVFISENNTCSLRTTVAQVMLIKDILLQPRNFPFKNDNRSYYKRFFPKFAAKAQAICVTGNFIENALIKQYPSLLGKVTTVLHGLPQAYVPANAAEREKILLKYADGHEYFLCECSAITEQNLIAVLKAFSIFKKRLKSGMRLVVLNRLTEIPVADFKNYKYRNEVIFISNFTSGEEQTIIAESYAALYLPSFCVAANIGLRCLQFAVPLITSSGLDYESMYKAAAVYADNDEKEIAAAMMELYKDEAYRSELISEGKAVSARYNWDESSAGLWQTISNYIPA